MEAVRDAAETHWRKAAAAAFVSLVTMPITAMFFLLISGLLIMGSAGVALVDKREAPGPVAFVGLGLMVGPIVYLFLALVQ